MVMLVTLDEAKRRLKWDGDVIDADLQLVIEGASQSVIRYLKKAADSFLGEDGEVIAGEVPADVKTATLMLTGILLRDPDGAQAKDWEQGYLPRPVTALLYALRDPGIA